jgi:23S rRNA (uracil1939-C5)-methyltransferase
MAKARKPLPPPIEVEIEGLTHEGRGLAHFDGKAVFVDLALPGERVRVRYTRVQSRFDEGVAVEVLRAAPERVAPRCPHFGVCGGCSLQHLDPAAQIRMKQDTLSDVFTRIGKVSPAAWLPPLVAGHWGYRRKARLGVRHVLKKGRVLVGFRERGTPYLAELGRCEVLHPRVGERLELLAETVGRLSIRDQVPQIEMAVGESPCVLVFRVMAPPSTADLGVLAGLAEDHGFHCYLQEGGPESIRPLPGQGVELHYDLPRYGLRLGFEPTDFTQVNLDLNRLMIGQALRLLDPQPDDAVLDLFCGLGNFSLPLARYAGEVLGVEADAGLIARAADNAARNGIRNVRFETGDLYGDLSGQPWLTGRWGKALLDPPRSGALEVLDWLPRLGVEKICYVSCYPSTLARDADRLVNALGYRLVAAGVMDMFPHTAHVESMAIFERAGSQGFI